MDFSFLNIAPSGAQILYFRVLILTSLQWNYALKYSYTYAVSTYCRRKQLHVSVVGGNSCMFPVVGGKS